MTIFQKGGSTHAPLTLLVTRVVLLHKAYGESNPLIPQLYVQVLYIKMAVSLKTKTLNNFQNLILRFSPAGTFCILSLSRSVE